MLISKERETMIMIINGKKLSVFFLLAIIISTGLFFGFSNNSINKSDDIVLQDGDKPAENEIWLDNLTFVPKIKTIKVGTKITWINKETAMHTVISGAPGAKTGFFESKKMGEGGKFSFTFIEAGVYKYYCGTHEDMMMAIIIVK
jgi:plastocyanin